MVYIAIIASIASIARTASINRIIRNVRINRINRIVSTRAQGSVMGRYPIRRIGLSPTPGHGYRQDHQDHQYHQHPSQEHIVSIDPGSGHRIRTQD